jgi:ABC-type Fe3+-hydroxamate transport system substrate-binding protein
MMSEIGKMTNKMVEANKIISIIQTDLAKLMPLNVERAKKILYLIWQDPFMAAGKNTFIDVMLQVAGFENVIRQNRYPELTSNEIQNIQPDYIFLSSEPYPFKEKHISYFQKLCPKTRIILADGELFSWYGSRLKHSAKYFQQLQTQLQTTFI